MNRFRVGIAGPSESERVVAVLDSLGEARVLADGIADFKPWIEWGEVPEKESAAGDDGIIWRRASFTASEKVLLEEIYLTARSELLEQGMAAEKVDRLLPLASDGSVPWE